MFEAHEWRVSTPSGLAQRREPGEGEVSDIDGCSQLIPADIHKMTKTINPVRGC